MRTESDWVIQVFDLDYISQQNTASRWPWTAGAVDYVICVVEDNTGRINYLEPSFKLNSLQCLGMSRGRSYCADLWKIEINTNNSHLLA